MPESLTGKGRRGDGIDSPKGLEGKTYSTWESPIEQATLKTVMKDEGADFDKVKLIPNNITDEPAALKAKQTDAIWVFYGWGGINADIENVDCDYWNFKDIDPVFDYYTPVIIANNDFLKDSPDTAKAFLEATEKGYEYAIENPKKAADLLIKGDDTGSLKGSEDLVYASQEWLSEQYVADQAKWGVIDETRWNNFYQWLHDNGLTTPEEGRVLLNGQDITSRPGEISYMLQKDLLFLHKKIIDNVALPLVLHGMKKKEAREKASVYFKEFGLEGTQYQYPSQLSGGMRQRAALLRTYLSSKGVALLDEPFSALDTLTKTAIHKWYLDVMQHIDLATLFITHDIDEAILLSDRIYILNGKPGEIKDEIIIKEKKPRPEDFYLTDAFLAYKRDIIGRL